MSSLNLNQIKSVESQDESYTRLGRFSMRKAFKKQVKENILLFLTILSVVLGVGIGFLIRNFTNFAPPQRQYFGFLGELFLRMLKFLILPLIGSSLICGIASLGTASKTGKVASRAFIYYLSTTFIAAILGLILVSSIKPGLRSKKPSDFKPVDALNGKKISPVDIILDLVRNLFPDNIVQMTFMQYESKILPKYKIIGRVNNNLSENIVIDKEVEYWYSVPSERSGINVLGLVTFCMILGYTIPKMDKHGKVLLEFIEAVNEASIKLVEYIMWFSPIGICSLVCSSVLNMENPVAVFEKISYYMMTVLIGLFLHGLIILPGIYLIVTRKNILLYAKNMIEAMLIAVATSSSNATLPATFKCIEEKNNIPKSISRFVLPVGATINMDGTALYEAIAAIFIAQVNNIHLSFLDYIVTSFTATLASIGAAGVPSAGLVTMVIVLSALNLPQDQISLIYAVDWFLDRFRTMVNVWGDSIGAGVVAHLCEDKLDVIKSLEENQDGLPSAPEQIEQEQEIINKIPIQEYTLKLAKVNESFKIDEFKNETTL